MATLKIQDALNMAKADPNSEFASQLRNTIESGSIDKVAFEQGVDLTQYGRPQYKPPVTLNQFERFGQQFKDIPQDIQKTGQNIAETFRAGQERIGEAQQRTIEGEQGLASGVFQTLGEGARTAAGVLGDLFIGGASLITTPAEEERLQQSLTETVQALGKTDVGQGVAEIADQYNAFKEANPTIAANLEASLGFAEAIAEVVGAGPALKAGRAGTRAVGEGVEQVAGAARKAAGDVKLPTISPERRSVDKIVREITQEVDPKKVEKQTRALSQIDGTKVKTYDELISTVSDRKTSIAEAVDAELLKDTGVYSLDELALTKKGKTGDIVSNPVDESLTHLEELYTTSGDDLALDNLRAIRQKLESEGLTRKEVNDIAREYGQEFGRKAFRVDGTPTTSVIGQRFENTRKKLKEVARQGLTGDAAKALDMQYSDLISLDNAIEKVNRSVRRLENKTVDRGVIEKLSNQGAKLANMLTGGGLRGAISGLLQSNLGSKTMNALAIQDVLNKNLKALRKLDQIDNVIDTAGEAKIIDEVAKELSKQKDFDILSDTFLDTDKIVKDFGKRIKETPNKQGGFVKNPPAEAEKIDNLNPTEGLFVEYNPVSRALAETTDNITTFAKTADLPDDELVTVYRGATSNQGSIAPGDFITTSRELAESYAGEGRVLEKRVRAADILDDINEPLGDEYIYKPENFKEMFEDAKLSIDEFDDIDEALEDYIDLMQTRGLSNDIELIEDVFNQAKNTN